MAKSKKTIPDAERDVLMALGRLQEATVQQIREAILPVRELEASSISTLLKRLEQRKLVTKRKADTGKAFVFRTTAKSNSACRDLLKDLFNSVFAGDTMAFMQSFFETKKPTDGEIDQLQSLLDELRESKKSNKKKGKQ